MQVSSEHMNCITRIYDSVLDADAWTDMLEVLSGFAGAKAAYLSASVPSTPAGSPRRR